MVKKTIKQKEKEIRPVSVQDPAVKGELLEEALGQAIRQNQILRNRVSLLQAMLVAFEMKEELGHKNVKRIQKKASKVRRIVQPDGGNHQA